MVTTTASSTQTEYNLPLPDDAVSAHPTGGRMDLISDIADMLWESSQNHRINEVRREVNELRETARSSAASDPGRAGLDEPCERCPVVGAGVTGLRAHHGADRLHGREIGLGVSG